MDTDLNMDIDEVSWIMDHLVYCPVPWCSAHVLRWTRCGDKDGDYVGIHAAHIEYAKTQRKRENQAIESRRKAGLSDPELSVGLARLTQDAIDMGMVPGMKGRRRL